MLLQAILAAVIGTVVMTLSSTTEMQFRGRQASTAPGHAVNKILHLVGVPLFEGRALEILATWSHWMYGAAWGLVFCCSLPLRGSLSSSRASCSSSWSG
jgi:hypothetical protein